MPRPLSEAACEVLDFLYWTAEPFTVPHLGKLKRGMDDRNRIRAAERRLARLRARQLLVREERAGQIVCRITEAGKRLAVGGRDPDQYWDRPWDGQWRMVVFDLPGRCQAVRQRLLRWLRQHGFGYLQNSVWIHPDSISKITDALKDFRDDVESFTVMEARCCAGFSDAAIVAGAWDFAEINKRYEAHLSQTEGELTGALRQPATPAELRRRLRQERLAWARALAIDPLLPRRLLPPGYLGERAWQAHRSVMKRLLRSLHNI
jgi:phenylacetic acid degradation operon negative regulatory protein